MKKPLFHFISLFLSFIIAAAGFYLFFIHFKKPPAEVVVSGVGTTPVTKDADPAGPAQSKRLTARDHVILQPLPFSVGTDWQGREFPTGSFAEVATPRPPLGSDQPGSDVTLTVGKGAVPLRCSAVPAVKTATLLQAYRGGLIEVNEKEENADKIVTAPLDWTIACPASGEALSLAANSTLKLAGYEPIALSLAYQIIKREPHLQNVSVSLGPTAAKTFVFTGLEVRPTGQKRGAPVSADVETSNPGMAIFKLLNPKEAAQLVRNAQWMDFHLVYGSRKFILAVELPIAQALTPN